MTSIATKTGDGGETSLYSGERVSKCCARVDAYGTVDELQASLGLARSLVTHEEVAGELYRLQRMLVQAMAELATIGGEPRILVADVEELECAIDRFGADLSSEFVFQVPGDSAGSAALHVARTVARRSERVILSCVEQGHIRITPDLATFFNRLSDLCYLLARYEDEIGRSDAKETVSQTRESSSG